MDLSELLREATAEEALTIASVASRRIARPAVVATVASGGRRRRYVVAMDDEGLFNGLEGALRPESRPGACDAAVDVRFGHMGAALTSFGGRWLRRFGCVDEMHRTLSMAEVVKVERIDRAKVWGRA